MSAPRRACVLVSGGVDSSILVADLLAQGWEVLPLYVRSGFYWEAAELRWLRRLLRRLACPRLAALAVARVGMEGLLPRQHWSLTGRGVPGGEAAWDAVYLPGRNLVLLGQAGVHAALHGAQAVMLAVLKGNPFADARPRFLRSMQSSIDAAFERRIRVVAPYARLTKRQVLARVPGFPVELTFSCLRPSAGAPCGRCSKCAERLAAVASVKRSASR